MSFCGKVLKVSLYGESHSDEIGVKIEGLPEEKVDFAELNAFLDRRKAGNFPWSTTRSENDEPIVKGEFTCLNVIDGDVEIAIKNQNIRKSDYQNLSVCPRPSHADYVAFVKDKLTACPGGGGRFSGRMTAPMCIAGGIAKQLLSRRGISVLAYVSAVGSVNARSYLDGDVTEEEITEAQKKPLTCLGNADDIMTEIEKARADGDSVGGKVECVVFGMPVGIGDSDFDGLEGHVASAVFAVPAVKAVEFGLGTGFSDKRGSEANDPFVVEYDKVVTQTNNSGGINGGISNGMPILVRTTFRPTPSISKPQATVNLLTKKEEEIVIKGRHDACIVPRAVPVVEGMVALAILDLVLWEERK